MKTCIFVSRENVPHFSFELNDYDWLLLSQIIFMQIYKFFALYSNILISKWNNHSNLVRKKSEVHLGRDTNMHAFLCFKIVNN